MGEKVGGGPAFPVPLYSNDRGMTMLDYFAGVALQGVMSSGLTTEDKMALLADKRAGARWAYEMAETMLKERQNRMKTF